MKYSFYFLMLMIFVWSCKQGNDASDQQTNSDGLKKRENAIQLKEDSLKVKEDALSNRERHLDSMLKHIDTIGIYNVKIIGNWVMKMQCIETSCSGSAIGDSSTEQWKIAYQENRVLVNATMGNKLVRSYGGLFKGNTLELAVQKENSTEANIEIKLSPTQDNKMEGRREITQQDGCKIVYSLEAERM